MEHDELTAVREAGLRLLARREHSVQELRRKLLAREHPADLVETALATLSEEGLLSEVRFVEAYVRSRRGRGYGPLRIRAELRQRGVDPELAQPYLHSDEEDWQARALAQYRKRFGEARPATAAERARHYRFLSNRGFTAEQIRRVLDD